MAATTCRRAGGGRSLRRSVLAVAVACGVAACGADTSSYTAVPDPRPGDLRTDSEADVLPADYVAPDPPGGVVELAYGPDAAHRLDLLRPATDDAPVVVYLHSGGWIGGRKEDVPQMVLRFLELGFAVASVEYRLAPEHPFPAGVQDAKRAVRFLKSGGAGEGVVDPSSIVLYGASAGGLLAAFVASTPGEYEPVDLSEAMAAVDSSVAAIVSAVGPTDLVAMYADGEPWPHGAIEAFVACSPCDPARLEEASPITHLGAGLPPAYWVYGEADLASEPATQGEPIAEAWGELAGAQNSWFDVVDGAGHNLDQSVVNQRWIERFVQQAVAGTPPSPPA